MDFVHYRDAANSFAGDALSDVLNIKFLVDTVLHSTGSFQTLVRAS